MLKPSWIKTFQALSEYKNFTRTAEALDITQAAVSQHVQQLEAKFGVLVIRKSREIELTPKGFALLEYCIEVERAGKRLAASMSEYDNGSGRVGVICPGSLGLRIYPILLDIQSQYPDIKIHNRFAPDPEIIESVLANKYDMGFVCTKPDDPRLSVTEFCKEGLELIVPRHASVDSWQDLCDLGFIDHPDGQSMATRVLGRMFPNEFSVSGLPVNGFSNQISLILDPVARGFGFTVLPGYARQAYAENDKIKVLKNENHFTDSIWIIHRSEWSLSASALQVKNILSNKLNNDVQA